MRKARARPIKPPMLGTTLRPSILMSTSRRAPYGILDNAGILARIAGMFTARGYNIESLTVTDVSEDETISRITIVTSRLAAGDRPDHGPDRAYAAGPYRSRT